jgi:rhodanese-related sulfurtransferase
VKKVSKQKALDLITKGALLVDLRSPVAFRDGTIKGAVNLPFKNFLNKLLAIKATEKVIIFSDKYTDTDIRDVLTYADQLRKIDNIFVSTYSDLL